MQFKLSPPNEEQKKLMEEEARLLTKIQEQNKEIQKLIRQIKALNKRLGSKS